jgi:hypothetical protein
VGALGVIELERVGKRARTLSETPAALPRSKRL